MEQSDKETVVRQELECLLDQHSLTDSVGAADEIVLNYVLGVLECLSSGDDLDETEDVEPFAEMMNAHIQGFSIISLCDVGEWMRSTAFKLSQPLKPDTNGILEEPVQCFTQDFENSSSSSVGEISEVIIPKDRNGSSQPQREKRPPKSWKLGKKTKSHGEKHIVQIQNADSDSIGTLRELCPGASTAELQRCLHMSAGDVQEAASLLFCRQESGTAITKKSEANSYKKNTKTVCGLNNDESLIKDSILAKYSFVDTSQDTTEHRPGLFQKEQKKMIRYREGQVVSTKGERFSEIKKQESEEMKKTYVNLKPQRKYRFH